MVRDYCFLPRKETNFSAMRVMCSLFVCVRNFQNFTVCRVLRRKLLLMCMICVNMKNGSLSRLFSKVFADHFPDVSLTEAQIKGFAKLHHRWLSDNSETFVLFETGNGLRLADICKIVASDSSTWCMLMIVPLSVRYGAISRGPWAYNPRTQQVECVHRRVIVPRFPVTSGDWSRWEI